MTLDASQFLRKQSEILNLQCPLHDLASKLRRQIVEHVVLLDFFVFLFADDCAVFLLQPLLGGAACACRCRPSKRW
jgi:hypothetical protein